MTKGVVVGVDVVIQEVYRAGIKLARISDMIAIIAWDSVVAAAWDSVMMAEVLGAVLANILARCSTCYDYSMGKRFSWAAKSKITTETAVLALEVVA